MRTSHKVEIAFLIVALVGITLLFVKGAFAAAFFALLWLVATVRAILAELESQRTRAVLNETLAELMEVARGRT